LTFNIIELSPTNQITLPISAIETSPVSLISAANITGNNLILTKNILIPKNVNIRIKITSAFIISTTITETSITNMINHHL
jgi:hypothetical protein